MKRAFTIMLILAVLIFPSCSPDSSDYDPFDPSAITEGDLDDPDCKGGCDSTTVKAPVVPFIGL